jgi:methionyl-tRNA synthetase
MRPALFVPMMPTPNGPLHLGHIAGPYLKMDVLARALRQDGRRAALVTTTDSFETHVLQAAERLSLTVAETCAYYHAQIRRDFEVMGIGFDAFVDPLAEPYAARFRAVHAAVTDALIARGRTRIVDEPYLVDAGSGEAMLGHRLSGKCPGCGSATVGLVCETCGLQVTTEMLAASGLEGGGIWRTAKTIALAVTDTEKLRRAIAQTGLPDAFRGAMRAYVDDPRNVIRLSIPGRHGVAPYRHAGGTVMLYNTYFGHALFCGEIYRDLFPGADNPFAEGAAVETVTSCGLDNATDLSAVIAAADAHGGYRPFDRFLGNFFLTLEGRKFSTGARRAVFVSDVAQRPAIDVDALRLYLFSISPVGSERDFDASAFVAFQNRVFSGNLAGALARACATLALAKPASPSAAHRARLAHDLAMRRRTLSLESFAPADHAAWLCREAEPADADLDDASEAYAWVKRFAILAWPLLPGLCARLWHGLGHDGDPRPALFEATPAAPPNIEPAIPRKRVGAADVPVSLGLAA